MSFFRFLPHNKPYSYSIALPIQPPYNYYAEGKSATEVRTARRPKDRSRPPGQAPFFNSAEGGGPGGGSTGFGPGAGTSLPGYGSPR